MDIVFHPIGTIRSPYKDRKDAPMWGADDPGPRPSSFWTRPILRAPGHAARQAVPARFFLSQIGQPRADRRQAGRRPLTGACSRPIPPTGPTRSAFQSSPSRP